MQPAAGTTDELLDWLLRPVPGDDGQGPVAAPPTGPEFNSPPPADGEPHLPTPDPAVERQAHEAVREHGRVEVYVRNVITQAPTRSSKSDYERRGGGGFVEAFTDLDAARLFATEHRTFFNNCRVEVTYLARHQLREEASYGPDTVPVRLRRPVRQLVRDEVWRDAPGWPSDRPERIRHGQIVDSGTPA
ncbi:hypothetical protein GCM10027258_80260 [Amycolatopsis stemonae]